MKKYFISAAVVVLIIASFVLGYILAPQKGRLGTGFTINTSNNKYTDGADLYQNVQAMAERMTALTTGNVLQASSVGTMEAVAPNALSGVWEMFNTFELETNAQTATATNTLAITESGRTFFASGSSTTYILPATSTASGVHYKFVISGAIDENVIVRTSDLGNNIEGTLMVAGAVVDCDAEDTITFVADGENIGDYVELYSNGAYWFIGDSGALTASKLTCTTST